MPDVDALALGTCAFGRAIDAGGAPLDGGPPLCGPKVRLELRSPTPNERVAISVPLATGVRAIDGLLTMGRGARVGIFGPPGAGKTSLLESIADGCEADAVVVALVGERGREAQQWMQRRDVRTTLVCATSDRPAQERVGAARVAIAHAAALRDRGLNVLLVLDSLARCAGALRELGIAAGESSGRGGYPPSVFAHLARLVEVAGAVAAGSITLVATVINDGDDRDPVSEAAKSVLDGHIVLCARLAEAGHFPAIDVLASASRTMQAVAEAEHVDAALALRRSMAILERTADARALGVEPADHAMRLAVSVEPDLLSFLRQERVAAPFAATVMQLKSLARRVSNSETSR